MVVKTTSLGVVVSTFGHLSPLVLFSDPASDSLLVNLSTSKPFAAFVVSVHIDGLANLASWNSLRSQRVWNAVFAELVHWAANPVGWPLWFHWHLLGVIIPSVVVETIPFPVHVFVYVATMMPVALVPGPSVASETALDDAPVVPLATVVSVPGPLGRHPSPLVSHVPVVFLTPCANLRMVFVLGDEGVASFLLLFESLQIVEDTPVLLVNLTL